MPDAKTPTNWWDKMDEDKQELYLRLHPRSKMHKVASAKIKERLAKNPKERTKLRSALKTIAKNPIHALKGELKKIVGAPDKLSEQKKSKLKGAANDALKSKSPKKMLKAMVTGLALAGALSLGAAVMASGGLPYVIVGSRLLGDGKDAIQEVYQRVKNGEDVVKAMFNTMTNVMGKASRDPRMLAAALMFTAKNDKGGDKNQPKDSKKNDKPEKKQPKRQNVPKAKTKKEKANV